MPSRISTNLVQTMININALQMMIHIHALTGVAHAKTSPIAIDVTVYTAKNANIKIELCSRYERLFSQFFICITF